jgi:hypothetical protein
MSAPLSKGKQLNSGVGSLMSAVEFHLSFGSTTDF